MNYNAWRSLSLVQQAKGVSLLIGSEPKKVSDPFYRIAIAIAISAGLATTVDFVVMLAVRLSVWHLDQGRKGHINILNTTVYDGMRGVRSEVKESLKTSWQEWRDWRHWKSKKCTPHWASSRILMLGKEAWKVRRRWKKRKKREICHLSGGNLVSYRIGGAGFDEKDGKMVSQRVLTWKSPCY